MISASRSGRASEGDGRYDFDRLERSVEYLIREHERLSAERAELLGELLDRELRISTLESRLDAERATRAAAVGSVNQLLARLEQLHASVVALVEPAR